MYSFPTTSLLTSSDKLRAGLRLGLDYSIPTIRFVLLCIYTTAAAIAFCANARRLKADHTK